MDTALIDRLIEILGRETAVYEGILKLSKEKTDIIVAGKVTELESITKLEQSIIMKLADLEEEREQLVGKLAAELGLPAAELTLTGLLKALPQAQAKRVEACQQTLPSIINELQGSNVLNSKLIRNSLEYIDFSVNILSSAGDVGNNYGNSGQSNDPKKRTFFDVKL